MNVDVVAGGVPAPWAGSIRSLRVRLAVGAPDAATITLSVAGGIIDPEEATELRIAVAGVDVGRYSAHTLRGDTRAGTVTIEASAVDAGSLLRQPRDRTWTGQTIGEMVATIARDADLTPAVQVDLGARVCAAGRQQIAESDFSFLSRLAASYNAGVLVQDGRLVVTQGDRVNVALPPLRVDPAAWVTWQRRLDADPERVRAAYLAADGVSVELAEVGAGARVRRLPATYPDQDSALAAAASTLAAGRTARHSVRVTTALTPAAQLLQPLETPALAFPPLSISEIEHHVGGRAAASILVARPRNAYPA